MKGKKGHKGGHSNYSKSFRLMVAQDYESGDLSYSQVAEKYNLPSKELPKWWVRSYRKSLELGELPLAPMTEEEKRKQKSLEKRIAALEKQLGDRDLKILGLETMIDVAEEILEVDIRKKPGTKQSND